MLTTHDRRRGCRVCRESFAESGRLGRDTGPGQRVPERFCTNTDQFGANGVEVSGVAPLVRITHADPALDSLVIDGLTGDDDVAIDPALAALILVSAP